MPRFMNAKHWYAMVAVTGVIVVSGLGTGISFALTPMPEPQSAGTHSPGAPSSSSSAPTGNGARLSASATPGPSPTSDPVPPIPAEGSDPPVAPPAPVIGTQPIPSAPPTSPTRPPTSPSVQPSASNTGVPPGVSLTRYDGDIVITQPGTVIDSLDVYGLIWVEAPNVTIRNSIVRGRPVTSSAALIYAGYPQVSNLLIEDVELVAANPSPWINGVMGYRFTLLRANIHGVIDQVHIFGNDVTVKSSWLHDNLHFTDDPTHSDGSHDDNIQVQTGSNIVLTGNTLSGSHNASLMVTEAQGVPTALSYTGNWASNGACTVNISQVGSGQPLHGLTVSGNHFGVSQFNCPIVIDAASVPGVDTSDNTMMSGAAFRVISR